MKECLTVKYWGFQVKRASHFSVHGSIYGIASRDDFFSVSSKGATSMVFYIL